MKVVWTDLAVADLKAIRDFIANENPQAAAKVAKRLVTKVRLLRDQPMMGRVVEGKDARELVVGDYIIGYRVVGDRVELLRVHHGRQPR